MVAGKNQVGSKLEREREVRIENGMG